MAIYHLHAKVIQRSKGRNIIAAAAYRRAVKLFDQREGKNWNYSNKQQVVHSELTIPQHAPAWLQELAKQYAVNSSEVIETLWNQVDQAEKRVDSQLAREIEFALPIELTQDQAIALTRSYVTDQFALRGMVADWNIHWEANNPHVHVLLTMRELLSHGFGRRVLEWNQKQLLVEWREQWSHYANFHLQLYGHTTRIDHRSYQDQGLTLIPSKHEGRAAREMHARGVMTDIMQEAKLIREQNEAINLNKQSKSILTLTQIKEMLKNIEYHDSVFGEKQLLKVISKFIKASEAIDSRVSIDAILLAIKSCDEVIALGLGADGKERFTTKTMFAIENNIQTLADKLQKTSHFKLSQKQVTKDLHYHQLTSGKVLTNEQLVAVKHILKPTAISCLVGRAGDR